MNPRKLFTALFALAAISMASPVFAEKIGVTFSGDSSLESSISDALKGEGHEVVNVSSAASGRKLDSVAAASIGKQTGVSIIVSGRKLGGVVVLKVLSTKNDTVAGGTCPANDSQAAIDQVKKILSDNKSKMLK